MGEAAYDITIVGYGPVGAASALFLADAGLRVAVLERSERPVVLPRAVGLDAESVRAFQRIGFGDPVAAILQAARPGESVSFTNSKREPYFAMEMPEVGVQGWRDVAFFDQPELEALLRARVAETDGIDVCLGHEVVDVRQTADQVTVRTTSAAGESTFTSAYLLGCDGASSFVREAVGIEWTSLGYDQDWLVVDIVQGPEADLPLMTMQVCDPARLTTYVCVKDPNRRWEFQLVGDETREQMLEPERIRALLDDWLPREHYEIRRAAVYQFHAATAERWSVGRVFLAGDAAHQTPPFLGQGLNAGFRDAVNLGWKLPLVLSGRASPSLLDTYPAERDAHARDLVDWAVAIGQLMETFAAREAGRPDPYPSADPSAGYGQGRTAPPLREGVLIAEQVGETSATGSLFSQPTVRGADGRTQKLDDLLGPGFAVVARDADALALAASSRALLDRVGGRTLAIDTLELVSGTWDRSLDRGSAAIVRPDRYVFGVVDADWPLDRLLAILGEKLQLEGPGSQAG